MGIRPRILVGLLVAALGIVAWRVSIPAEPVYDGKKISHWIARSGEYYEGSDHGRIGGFPRSADSNAIPYLVRALNTQENPSSRPYVWLWFRLPAQLQLRLPPPVFAEQMRFSTAVSLGRLGAVAKPAIPALIRAIKEDKSEQVRGRSAWSLGQLGNQDQRVIAELTDALNDKSGYVRLQAAEALESCGPAAQNAIPVLMKRVADDPYAGPAAANALKAIRSEPQASAAATRNQ